MGYSWGGYESLVIPFDPTSYRTATRWHGPGPALRFHIGLEAVEDLIDDLSAGLRPPQERELAFAAAARKFKSPARGGPYRPRFAARR